MSDGLDPEITEFSDNDPLRNSFRWTKAEAAHFGSPKAIDALTRGLAVARAGRTSEMTLRSDS